jgi:hypothetical protein
VVVAGLDRQPCCTFRCQPAAFSWSLRKLAGSRAAFRLCAVAQNSHDKAAVGEDIHRLYFAGNIREKAGRGALFSIPRKRIADSIISGYFSASYATFGGRSTGWFGAVF